MLGRDDEHDSIPEHFLIGAEIGLPESLVEKWLFKVWNGSSEDVRYV